MAARPKATPEPGIWRIPDGEAFYAGALAFQTTTNLTPDQAHEIGLKQVADLDARMDVLLRAEGLTEGTHTWIGSVMPGAVTSLEMRGPQYSRPWLTIGQP